MNILLWVLQVLAALLYGSSGVVKVFMFDKVSQDSPVLWRLAAESLDDPGHPRARVHGRAHRPRRVPLAAAADDPGCHGLGGREPRVRRGARQVPRGRAHDLERRAGPPHGVHRVWPDSSEADPLTGGPLFFAALWRPRKLFFAIVLVLHGLAVSVRRKVPGMRVLWRWSLKSGIYMGNSEFEVLDRFLCSWIFYPKKNLTVSFILLGLRPL
jgi:hypothetical protein